MIINNFECLDSAIRIIILENNCVLCINVKSCYNIDIVSLKIMTNGIFQVHYDINSVIVGHTGNMHHCSMCLNKFEIIKKKY